MHVSLTMKSGNRKVGAIPVSTTEEDSCPRECPHLGTDCYARFGPLGMHWRKVKPGGRGDNWTGFCRRVKTFPRGQTWRHNQAGDLPQNKRHKIHRGKTLQLARASRHTKGWTYTHYDPTDRHNRETIKAVNETGGLTINLSADSPSQADEYADLNIGPVVCVVPLGTPHIGNTTPAGRTLTICPAQTDADLACVDCKLCQHSGRKAIIGFIAHGTAKKRLSASLS